MKEQTNINANQRLIWILEEIVVNLAADDSVGRQVIRKINHFLVRRRDGFVNGPDRQFTMKPRWIVSNFEQIDDSNDRKSKKVKIVQFAQGSTNWMGKIQKG